MAPSAGRKRRRLYGALALAVALHAAVLAWLGLARPRLEEPFVAGGPPLIVDLLPSLDRASAPALARAASRLAARARRPRTSQARVLAVDTPPLAPILPPAVAAAGAEAPGCEPEVLILLTPAEKARCRNQIETAEARRTERNAAAEAARRVQEARRSGPLDAIAPEKRAAYEGALAARQAVREDFRMRGLPRRDGLAASGTNIDVNVSARCTMGFGGGRLGRLRCPTAPPAGAFTEEARTKPP